MTTKKHHPGEKEPELVPIRSFGDELQANLAKTTLEAAGIDCMLSRDDGGGMEPFLSMGHGIRLLVRSEDAEQAAKLLK